MRRAEMPEGLRRAYVLVLAPIAFLAPLPLFWTEGALPTAVLLFECATLLLWWRAERGRPARLSDTILNAIGLSYFLWLGFEVWVLRHGLLRSVSHLLLFTAIAKLASLKRPGEARTALLVLFLLTLASASSSTHVSSLAYLAAVAFFGFRALGRLAVLADFEHAPPDRVLRSIPTAGLAVAAISAALFLTAPLFYALPRLRSPFALAPFRVEDALSTSLAADRVELESFGAAKRSERVVLRMRVDPQSALARVVRLREAVFTEYRDGVWTRNSYTRHGGGSRAGTGDFSLPVARRGSPLSGNLSVELNLFTNGFLFLPYGAAGLQVDSASASSLPDGVVRVTGRRRAVQYTVGVRAVEPEGIGSSAIDPASVPREVREYGARLTAGLTDPLAISSRIRDHFARDFVYTLDPPRAEGDPVVHFLLRSKAGHCEYFASAAAMMLASRGVPARLVTGAYGGELGFLSRSIVVRAGNLHAWVEVKVGGGGFSVFDPTPPAGIPEPTRRVSMWKRVSGIAREIEFFYDRRILGFDSADQAGIAEAIRESAGDVGRAFASWRELATKETAGTAAIALGLAGLFAVLTVTLRRARRRASLPHATRGYLALRRLASRRVGPLSPAVAPAEVARLFAEAVPAAREEAEAIVAVYCASAFGGRDPDRDDARELDDRLRRLRNAVRAH